MKTITYEYEKMKRAGQLLNSLVVSGSSNFRALAELANILDSGTLGETYEREVKENGGDMGKQTIQPNKLAKPPLDSNSSRGNKPK